MDGLRFKRFLRSNLAYLLLLPVFVLFGTLVHEGAHAAVVLAQGGRVTDFDVVPRVERGQVLFGSVEYEPDEPASAWVDWTVAWAPTAVWLLVTTATFAFGRRRLGPDPFGRCVAIALFHLPLVDLSMALQGLLRGIPDTDLNGALAGREPVVVCLGLVLLGLYMELGRRLFQRIWPGQLSDLEYRVGLFALLALPWLRR